MLTCARTYCSVGQADTVCPVSAIRLDFLSNLMLDRKLRRAAIQELRVGVGYTLAVTKNQKEEQRTDGNQSISL